MGELTGNRYKPSNGSEGMWFENEYCMNCLNCDPDPNGKKQCQILFRAFWYDIDDNEYPVEWVYDENDKPMCTEYVKWDWGNDGDPDDPDNPKAPVPYDPRQFVMPFILGHDAELVNKKGGVV